MVVTVNSQIKQFLNTKQDNTLNSAIPSEMIPYIRNLTKSPCLDFTFRNMFIYWSFNFIFFLPFCLFYFHMFPNF